MSTLSQSLTSPTSSPSEAESFDVSSERIQRPHRGVPVSRRKREVRFIARTAAPHVHFIRYSKRLAEAGVEPLVVQGRQLRQRSAEIFNQALCAEAIHGAGVERLS